MLWLYRYFRGYLKIIIKGEFNEIVLNICAVNAITLWKSRLIKQDIETCILIKDFRKLKNLIRGSKTRIHILKKYGLPFKIEKNKKRSGLLLGIVLLFSLLKIASCYIWVIDIFGNNSVSDKEIYNSLKKIGITEGIKASEINPKTDREHLLLECDSLAWASLNIESSRLTVNVTEIQNSEGNSEIPSNLKANADGIIKKIDVTKGNCIVKIGDTVKKGDLLVSGINEGLNGTFFTESLGSIYAETVREYNIYEKFNQKITYKTGDKKTKKVLEIFSLKIPLYLGKETKKYTSSTFIKNIKLFSKTLPIKIHSREFNFVNDENITYTKTQLEKILEENLNNAISKDSIEDFSVVTKNFSESENGILLNAIIKSEENIAVSEEILTDNASYSAE